MKFQISSPITPFKVFQGFGKENTDPSVLAVYQKLGLEGHNGLDCMATHGQPIYATHDGMAYYEIDSNQGHGVVLRTNQTYDYNGEQVYFKTISWHMCDYTKEPQFKSPIPNNGQGHAVLDEICLWPCHAVVTQLPKSIPIERSKLLKRCLRFINKF